MMDERNGEESTRDCSVPNRAASMAATEDPAKVLGELVLRVDDTG